MRPGPRDEAGGTGWGQARPVGPGPCGCGGAGLPSPGAAPGVPTASKSGRATARSPTFLKPLESHLRGGGWGSFSREPTEFTRWSFLPQARPRASPHPLPQTINYQPPFSRERRGAGWRPRGNGSPDHFCMTIDGREGAGRGGRTAAVSVFSPW